MLEIKSWVVPNQRKNLHPFEVMYHNLQANVTCESFNGYRIPNLYTSDGLKLDVLFFDGIHPATKQPVGKSQKTVVIFCGRGTYHYAFTHLSEKYRAKGCNVVLFQYRGVGESEGEIEVQDDIIKDGRAIVDYLEWHHNVPRFLLAIHGHSMGGGFGTAVARSRPGVSITSERSFSTLKEAAVFAAGNRVGQYLQNVVSTSSFNFSPGFQAGVVSVAGNFGQANGWELNPAQDWFFVQGRKCVVYHPDDNIIPRSAQLASALMGKTMDTTYIEIQGGADHPKSTHGRPLASDEFEQVYKAMYPFEVDAPVKTSLDLLWTKFCLLRETKPYSLGVLFFQEVLSTYPSGVSEEVLWQLLFLVKAQRVQNGSIAGLEGYSIEHLKSGDVAALFTLLRTYFTRFHFQGDIIASKYLELHDYLLWLCGANPIRGREIVNSFEQSQSPESKLFASQMKAFLPY